MDIANLTSSPASPAHPAAQRGLGELASGDFFKLIITDLLNQDPLEPMDNDKLLQQLASIREMEMNQQFTASLQLLTDQQRSAAATSLIGKVVEGGAGPDGRPLRGVVTGVHFDPAGAALLRLGSALSVPLTAVTEVSSVEELRSSVVGNSVTAAVFKDGRLQEVQGKIESIQVHDGQLFFELDSGDTVPQAALKGSAE
jgi:flagellar basal-body rod modification protein FlgD